MKYEVLTIGSRGNAERREIEADSISILDGVNESLVLLKKGAKLVLAISQANFVSAAPVSATAASSRIKQKPAALRVV